MDKTSSAELSEAINSQWQWFKGAVVCYVYLEDVDCEPDDRAGVFVRLEQCRWLTRGWTLQELIAPTHAVFFDARWRRIGTKIGLSHDLERITGVPSSLLQGNRDSHTPTDYSVAERMSWAANRRTTRPEDMAYCLLGVFDVHMPILYGEGGPRAFRRLQRKILKSTNDQSLLAWTDLREDRGAPAVGGVFADSPAAFTGTLWEGASILAGDSGGSIFKQRMDHSNIGLTAWMPLIESLSERVVFAALNCQIQHEGEPRSNPWMVLWRTGSGSFLRINLLRGMLNPSQIMSPALPLPPAEMVCVEDRPGTRHTQAPGDWELGRSVGILLAFPAGKQAFKKVASFPPPDDEDDEASAVGIFRLCRTAEDYYHGILAFEDSTTTTRMPPKRLCLFFARSKNYGKRDANGKWCWTCRVLPSVNVSLGELRDVSVSELGKICPEDGLFRAPVQETSLWRGVDQLGSTVVRIDHHSPVVHGTERGALNIASVVFDHPGGIDDVSPLSFLARELAV
ncbi:hypothetical protein B0T16DRAFT_416734 [Cercophora newfieldiana]|uniref:DUF8212 domain-containing protein n=1 Tax=Cercophora newfieldiana TaxID=92897 RepID=A0AA39Y0Q4_9PEZI|nr:hypothetical protein B0T16DRAFT_416734 [Cercophora newfieldiana]